MIPVKSILSINVIIVLEKVVREIEACRKLLIVFHGDSTKEEDNHLPINLGTTKEEEFFTGVVTEFKLSWGVVR